MAMTFDIRISGLDKAVRAISQIAPALARKQAATHDDIGLRVQRDSRRASPFEFGDLERSIDWRAGADWTKIFVATNSAAGQYAEFIHDGKYNLGFRSLTKMAGMAVGPKYIERAIKVNRTWILDRFAKATGEVVRDVEGS